jgi:hypothetical protein
MAPHRLFLHALLVMSPLLTPVAWAQNFNWRGTIVSLDEKSLNLRLRDESLMAIGLSPATPVSITQPFSMQDILPGMVLGVTTVRRADGATVAIDVRPIPATAPQGLSPHDLQAQSTMTNAVLEAVVANSGTQEITLNYKTGSVKVLVPPGTPMSRAAPGSRSDLKAGETVFVASRRNDDGSFTAVRVQVSKDGVKPTQ